MSRNRAWRRKKNYSKAIRKMKLSKSYAFVWEDGWYDHLGQYIKGKIHCSCPLCSAKTRSRKRYGGVISYKHSDKIKIDSMDYKTSVFLKGIEE